MKMLHSQQLAAGTAPFQLGPYDSSHMMRWVLLACLPAVLLLSWSQGPQLLSQLLQTCGYVLVIEAAVARLRGLSPRRLLRDNSALVTAFILALALPLSAAWWVLPLASAIALLLAKHSFGGLGQNPFNPAMVAYLFILLLFPGQMSDDTSLLTVMRIDFTSLDAVWQDSRALAALAFLLGGAVLLLSGVISWQIPFGLLVTLLILAQLWPVDDSRLPGLAVMSAGTMFCAFFIATDPVTAAGTALGKLLYGALIGALLFILFYRFHAAHAIAIAVLIGNLFAPLIDLVTPSRIYGHPARWRLHKRSTHEPD